MYNIDDFDMKILTLLQANGRLTNQELSDLVGLSASQCSRRRISLEQAQLIRGYHARLAPEAVGLGMVGLIEVSLTHHGHERVDSFHELLEQADAVLDAYKTTGDADYLLKVAVADLAALSDFISKTLLTHSSVGHVKTAVVLNRIKENGLLPVAR
ncbi:MAG: Lrp/AsnC family transcriptional regulator [Gibbsiella quercinecans]|jgi:DNA-binding Lrp family transcriptional regulator|uniref:AsnC family transcriptional regulator n=2 Tax=Gibbsiella TaxID=929812 RepID=A0A250B2I2_9GAMM|nr:Lrp/AsnC family transcriptional regulator [Gibbsiella quercinecans]ATA20301.1 AsnC family transcriptional regulator [Gibbsiella quercinecans]RLM03838.1 AsnC family transcriptional regulator [Gibbsiella quercinecans]RLM12323.1 AsnC family transcriptional regulator [Gibbsiella quercinecans]RLM14819.1 AsnC family transcriptional regulator [Gibbsiella quercinecans]TCT88295.1 DNA-binding Lrp family transcriptional regulator [Gibbsiella quercinecans]